MVPARHGTARRGAASAAAAMSPSRGLSPGRGRGSGMLPPLTGAACSEPKKAHCGRAICRAERGRGCTVDAAKGVCAVWGIDRLLELGEGGSAPLPVPSSDRHNALRCTRKRAPQCAALAGHPV